MHIGYWTDKDERWYLGRLHDIKSGNEGPKHARKWAGALKNRRAQTNLIVNGAQSLAREKLYQITLTRT